MSEWTLSSFHPTHYGASYSPVKPDPSRCCAGVWEKRWPRQYQCSKPRGYGPEKAYCKVHDPAAVAAREAASEAKYVKEMERSRIEWAAHRLFEALCKIADGDNDPRATAAKAIRGLQRPAPSPQQEQTK